VQGTQSVESYHWLIKGPHMGWQLWSTRRLDAEYVTLVTSVSEHYLHKQTLIVHGELLNFWSCGLDGRFVLCAHCNDHVILLGVLLQV
jgi:hypothetical protein